MSEFTANRLVTINVDVQNDFCPEGRLAVNEGDAVIPILNRLNRFTRDHNGIVIATGDQHPAVTPHFDTWPVHCVAGTKGAELHKDLDIQAGDIIIDKGTGQTDGYSGFEGHAQDGQTIESIIRPREQEHVAVVIGGLATDYCVLSTTLDALEIARQVRAERQGKISVFAIRDAMRAVNIQPDDGDEALRRMEQSGATIIHSFDILNNRALGIIG